MRVKNCAGHRSRKRVRKSGRHRDGAQLHGRTMAALSATGSRRVQAGFEPLVSGFIRAPFNDVKAIENISEHSNEITAIMLEPIQGEAGIRVPDPGYLEKLRSICDENGWMLI